jgi:hypothetical protein
VHLFLTSKVWVELGAYFPNHDFSAKLDGTTGNSGSEVDFERALGFDDNTQSFSGEIGWQFSRSWAVAAQYFSFDRTNSRILDEDIEWSDVVYEVGAEVRGGSSLDVTRIVTSYRFFRDGPHDLRAALGVHWLNLGAFIEGDARLNDNTVDFQKRGGSADGPLPNIGAWYRYSPSEKWVFSVRLDWLEASVGDFGGRILDLSAGANYSVWKNVGIGINYQHLELDVRVDSDSWNGDVKTSYSGPVVYISGYW